MSRIDRRSFLIAGLLAGAGCADRRRRVALYCAQDREFAEEILRDFRGVTGIEVAAKFDTEAQKSVSLFEELLRERDRPRCDLFWNNEILNTIRLRRAGLLEPIDAPAGGYPEWTRPADGSWRAFAARARVLIVNTKLLAGEAAPASLLELTQPRWRNRVAMAKPQFGTTATQAACLANVLGEAAARAFYQGLKDNGVEILAGNKPVARAVADGRYAAGLTDSDDAIGEIDAGREVAMVLPDRDGHPGYPRLGTLLIPNTLAVIRGAPNPAGARALAAHLLSPAIEQRLAEGGGFQIPLNADVTARLHPSLPPLSQITPMRVDWEGATDAWEPTQVFLRDLFAR